MSTEFGSDCWILPSCRAYVMSFDTPGMWIWLPPRHVALSAVCKWCRWMSTQCLSDCCILPLLQTVRDLSFDVCRMSISVLPHSSPPTDCTWSLFDICRMSISVLPLSFPPEECPWCRLISSDCQSNCCALPPPADCAWCHLMYAQWRSDYCVLPPAYMMSFDISTILIWLLCSRPSAACTWSHLMSPECRFWLLYSHRFYSLYVILLQNA